MLRFFHALCAIILLAQSASAGPWLREKGTGFSALSGTLNYFLDTTSKTYLEYGLTDKTTLVADIGVVRLNMGEVVTGTLSLRRAISRPHATSKWAYELGVGGAWDGIVPSPHLRTGLSWGRGINLGQKSGWVTVETAVIWDLTQELHVGKIDATAGINFTDITSGLLQIYTAHNIDGSAVTLAPSLVFRPRDSKLRVQIGAESLLGDYERTAVKIGFWREF